MKVINFNYTSLIIILLTTFLSSQDTKKASLSTHNSEDSEKPNIIFYLADDQDQLDYGCYGNPKVMTSNVDKLAKEGLKFTNFYTSQAICTPSRSQIYTGMYSMKNGAMANHLSVKPSVISITTHLQDAGYEVILAGKSHVNPSSVFNWSHYFKDIDHRYLPLHKIDNYLKNATKPFCMFVASDYPHGPYPDTENYTKEDIYKLPYQSKNIPNHKPGYYQNIDDDNEQLGSVLNFVDKHGLKNNTLFIYASDHGISGKWGLSEQGLKVPFIARWPGKIKPNTTSNTLLTFVDVLPTFLEIADKKPPKGIDGKSFYKTLKGNDDEIHDYIFGLASRQNIRECKVFPSRSVRGHRYKLILNFNALEVYESNLGDNPIVNKFIKIGAESFPNTPYEELYDLENDPYQKNNLANNRIYENEKIKLRRVIEDWMKSQNDYLLTHKMPLIKPTLHPLDENSKWNKVSDDLAGKLTNDDYIKLHY